LNSITVCWNASTDNIAVASYEVYVNNVFFASTKDTCFTITELSANKFYLVYVRASDEGGNTSAASKTINIKTSDLEEFQHEISVYPNPSANDFYLNISSPETTFSEIIISDITGKIRIVQKETTGQNMIEGNKLEPGIYFITILSGKSIRNLKVIKIGQCKTGGLI